MHSVLNLLLNNPNVQNNTLPSTFENIVVSVIRPVKVLDVMEGQVLAASINLTHTQLFLGKYYQHLFAFLFIQINLGIHYQHCLLTFSFKITMANIINIYLLTYLFKLTLFSNVAGRKGFMLG